MNYQKIHLIQLRLDKNKKKLNVEKDTKKKEILKLKNAIDEYKIKIERLK